MIGITIFINLTMATDWLLRVGDGNNFKNSAIHKIWGIQSTTTIGKHFTKTVRPGDRLWFIKSKSQGKVLAVATYCLHNKRDLGPLIDLTPTNEELGWTNNGPDWISDTEIHYTHLYDLENCDLFTKINGPSTIRKYDEKCQINLSNEYSYIIKYSKVKCNV